jgi:hypothetical protein
MKSKLNKIRELLADLNCEELATLRSELEEIAPFARKPTPEEALLAPGHYFEERTVTTGTNTLQYVYERWYEREGRNLKHKGKMLHKGSLSDYLAKNA